ncbi:MAG TPA: pyridoxamine 5'-phosphate oxidase family protein [Ilumatobacter sp.]|nr:pyridoxamine 5'-phosphate oxidase family protein [Ilumatobacter sp.]
MTEPAQQKRGRKIAMSSEELDAYLAEQRTIRVACVGADGAPHVTPLWFVWDGSSIWLTSIVASQRWTNIMRDPRVSLVVDSGGGFMELCGVEIDGTAEVVGEVPRTGEPNEALTEPERLFGEKYAGGSFGHDGRHAWLRITPIKLASWDFKKINLG